MKITQYSFRTFILFSTFFLLAALFICCKQNKEKDLTSLKENFLNPPDSVRPGVYWYFMDGNLSKEGITKDLEAMKAAGIGSVVFLEVNVGVPRGPIKFLSPEWQDMFKHAYEETKRLGIEITLGVGPGWTGSGGPWVKGEESMQHLVASSVSINKSGTQNIVLPKPAPRKPFFGEWGFTPESRKEWQTFYQDVAVLAFPTPSDTTKIEASDEKALYYRAPYSSAPGVKQFLPMYAEYSQPADAVIDQSKIIDLTYNLKDSILTWDVPPGNWTIMRFGARNNGAATRPAPLPGVGLEADKFDTIAINKHLDIFIGELFRHINFDKEKNKNTPGGLRMLHMDSWEMGAQNWTSEFRNQFQKRRGYDPLPYFPVYKGFIVGSRELSERFLWDLRLTSQELVLENHAGHLKTYAHRHGLGLSIEPYDMNPTADLELGAVADMPMCEFWSNGYGFNTAFSTVTGSSLAHLKGQSVVPSEAFTSERDGWDQYPGSIKNQTDWALTSGITKLVYHTFQHQPLADSLRPGMTMGPYGVHWDRNQTWWYMSDAYHKYVARSQYMLQQGRTVSDILYLSPEGSPHVFRAPDSAFLYEDKSVEATKQSNPIFEKNRKNFLPDKKGYSFDACPPSFLYSAKVKDGQVVFPSGATYRIMVLPTIETMTPQLLKKVKDLIADGATVVGVPPVKSPSLANYPTCDTEIQALVKDIWGSAEIPAELSKISMGKGFIYWNREMKDHTDNLYPNYEITSKILKSLGIGYDFSSTENNVRYTHRTTYYCDIYFVSNRTDHPISSECTFRITGKTPELWDPMTGETRALSEFSSDGTSTVIPLLFAENQGYFIVFSDIKPSETKQQNFALNKEIQIITTPWTVSFNPKWGGPANVIFNELEDWSKSPTEGIKYYSGSAIYTNKFDLGDYKKDKDLILDLGKVCNIARITLNGNYLGIAWTAPWRVNISKYAKEKDNELKVEVVNLWANRLIGDEQFPDDGLENITNKHEWPEWFLNKSNRASKRYTFTTFKHYNKDSPLSESGLLGPVTILEVMK